MEQANNAKTKPVAIIGISLFCPAGDSVASFWDGIASGGDFIREVPPTVIEPYHFSGKPNGIDQFYCKRGGFSGVFKVDPLKYGIMPIAADGIDPEQLISLAGADYALLDAGIDTEKPSLGKCSIIIGKGNFSGVLPLRCLEIMRTSRQVTTLLKEVLPELTEQDLEKVKVGYQKLQGRYAPDIAIGMMPNLVASLVANKFNMHGPAYTVDAACASGVVAIDHSIALLRSGQCDIAVAGGMHAGHSAMFWGALELLNAMSHKQMCKPFSTDADGLLVGQGGGFLVLKTLGKAIADGDRIYAVINETSVCSDGAGSHVMVTSVDGQTRVLEQAWQKSGMDPERIGYIEAHGTGTIVGDRTEIATLGAFFGDKTHPRAYVGSIKSNIGHTMAGAGMMGIIKTALMLYFKKIPPTLHCENPLPGMFESRFLPPGELMDWDEAALPLVAGVNAFGFGGINAHAILTAYQPAPGAKWFPLPRPYRGETLMLSAVDGPALVAKLKAGDYTRTGGDYRLVVFQATPERINEAIAVVEKDKPWRGAGDIWFSNRPALTRGGKVAFIFPGSSLNREAETDSLSAAFGLPMINDLIAERDAVLVAGMTDGDTEVLQEKIKQLYDREGARIFIQIGLGSTVGLIEDTLAGKDFVAIATAVSGRDAIDQMRRIIALLFIEGRTVADDCRFLEISPVYRAKHSLLILPLGAPPLVQEVPELKAAVAARYGAEGPGAAPVAKMPAPTNPVARAANDNITEAIAVQQELMRFYAALQPDASGKAQGKPPEPPSQKTAAPKGRKGKTFEETLRLTLSDHPYLMDHAIIRQPKDWPFVEDLNPVVPFAMTLELFAEIALRHAPGKKLIKLSNVSALRWMRVEQRFEAVVKGEWIDEDTVSIAIGDFARADCTVGDTWPPVPAQFADGTELDVGPEIMPPVEPAVLYERFSFHGPLYQSGVRYKRIGAKGMSGLAKSGGAKGSLLDNMGQQTGLFLHLTQKENTISFPIRLKEMLFFDDLFDQSGIFDTALQITRLTNSTIGADGVYRRGGKAWLCFRDFVSQRFVNYMPLWYVLMKPHLNLMARAVAPGVFFYEHGTDNNTLLLLGMRYLNSFDREKTEGFSMQQMSDYVVSRVALKDAVRNHLKNEDGVMRYPVEFYTEHDENGRPLIRGFGAAEKETAGLFVSIAHKEGKALAAAADKPVGVDLEVIEEKPADFLRIAFTENERALLAALGDPEAVVRFWVAKEACAKKEGTGLLGNPKRFEVTAVSGDALTVNGTRVRTAKPAPGLIAGWTV